MHACMYVCMYVYVSVSLHTSTYLFSCLSIYTTIRILHSGSKAQVKGDSGNYGQDPSVYVVLLALKSFGKEARVLHGME